MAVRTPLVGYNDNIEYLGQTYHVQTEDSAGRRAHVITHLFADGGRIVTSKKTTYAEYVGQPDQEEKVRGLMRTQHRAMLVALRNGDFDQVLGVGESAPAPAAAALDLEPESLEGQVPDVEPEGASVAIDVDDSAPGAPPEPGAGRAASAEALEQVAVEAEQDFVRALGARTVVARPRSHRPTPPRPAPPRAPGPGSGNYSLVGKQADEVVDTVPGAGSPEAPPRRRRFPQTSPGRSSNELRAALEAAEGAAQNDGGGEEGSGALGSRDQFGARFVSNRRLDEVVAEVLAQLLTR